MEAGGSEGDRTGDGSVKPKRQMKTPFQLEALERTYAGCSSTWVCQFFWIFSVFLCVLVIWGC